MWAGEGRLAGGAGWPAIGEQAGDTAQVLFPGRVRVGPGAATRSGVVLFARPVDVLEQSHGKGHSQDLEDKDSLYRDAPVAWGQTSVTDAWDCPREPNVKCALPSMLGNKPENKEITVSEATLETQPGAVHKWTHLSPFDQRSQATQMITFLGHGEKAGCIGDQTLHGGKRNRGRRTKKEAGVCKPLTFTPTRSRIWF